MPLEEPGSTAIVVLTPEVEPLADAFYREHSSAGRDGMTPHVTLIVPFVPAGAISEDIDQRLRRLFERFEPFDYDLRRFEYFESGVLYLAPEPTRPFIDLVVALIAEFPGYPPYEGLHDEVIPHLTVAYGDDALLAEVEADVMPKLPIEAHVTEAVLLEELEPNWGRWGERARFKLSS